MNSSGCVSDRQGLLTSGAGGSSGGAASGSKRGGLAWVWGLVGILGLGWTAGAAEVAGTIASATTWRAADGPIEVTGALTVAEGAVLTVEAGTTVRFRQYTMLVVRGRLEAVGTEAEPVRFEGTQALAGWWRGIQLWEGGSALLEGCRVAHSGYWDGVGVMQAGSGALTLRRTVVEEVAGDGLRLGAGYGALVSGENLFRNNVRGVRLGTGASWDDVTSTFAGNQVDVHVDGGGLDGEVVWGLNAAYSLYLAGGVTVGEGARLTVRAGTVVKFGQYGAMWVDGLLEARGTEERPIRMTDWRDDTVGGDANGDGNATTPGPGWWRALFVRNNGSAVLTHGSLRYAGYWDGAGLHKSGAGTLTLDRWEVGQVGGHGMRVDGSTGATGIGNTTFTGNTQSGLHVKASDVTAAGCTFAGNGHYGVLQEASDGLDNALQTFGENGLGSVGVQGGTMGRDVTWARGGGAGFVIAALGTITVPEGRTLTVLPGVEVRFAPYTGLRVEGGLTAVGTGGERIAFVGREATAGWWRGMALAGAQASRLEHCDVAHGGYWDGVGIAVTGAGALTLRDTVLRDHGGDGLRLPAGYGLLDSARNTFRKCVRGVRLGLGASWRDQTSAFLGNNVDLQVEAGTLTGPVVWGLQPERSMHVSGSITVGEAARLTVLPGTVLKFATYTGLWVDGQLEARGRATLPIHFTDWRDDTAGGDANGDGAGTLPAPGNWRGVFVRNAGSADLEHATLQYSGYWDSVGLQKTGTGDLTLRAVAVRKVAGDGVRVDGSGGTVRLEGCELTDNRVGLMVRNREVPLVLGPCGIWGNTEFGVRNQGPAEVDARSAWWGDPTGPRHAALNPGGLGNAVSDRVWFEPWRLEWTDDPGERPAIEAGPSLREARMGHHVATLDDGRVMVFGGHGTGFRALSSAESFLPGAGEVLVQGMRHSHDMAVFARLADGRWLLAGGSADLGIPRYAAAEVFDPVSGGFASVGDLVRFRSGAGSAALKDGRVLVAGAWWTHNDAHTRAEWFDPGAGGFVPAGALNHPRAYPVVLPTADGGAVVLGGTGVQGGAMVTAVERFDPETGGFEVVRAELFEGEAGWGLTQDTRAIVDQRMEDGRYLLLARRTEGGVTRHRLFTFDPAHATVVPVATEPGLPDSTEASLWPPVLDRGRGVAHLLAQVSGVAGTSIRLLSVRLADWSWTDSIGTQPIEPAYVLSGVGIAMLSDGRLWVTGGSEDGSNFRPVAHTFFLTPRGVGPVGVPALRVTREGPGRVWIDWENAGGAYVLESSTDCERWTPVLADPVAAEGRMGVTVDTEGAVRVYRLRSATAR
ncbi:MAG: right-handed parallel beta-helix repeat-containing protein [Verrucomicrobiae bacterium]|nr:right-handed parallel beta-helix repeat-containing protein [Verrucomicrobiae bacterium]